MEAFYKANHIRIYNRDCRFMEELGDESVDLIATDPPYGISFMGKDWDTFNELVDPQGAYQKKKGFKKLPRQNTISMTEFFIPIWKECLRILKLGAFAFVMCSPRADVMAKQVSCLQEAGFLVNFTPIFWAYASGFPKAQNIGKAVDKKGGKYLGWFIDYILEIAKKKGIPRRELTMLFPSRNNNPTGWLWNKQYTQSITVDQYNKIKDFLDLPFDTIEEAEREIAGKKQAGLGSGKTYAFTDNNKTSGEVDITLPSTPQAKALDGSYAGFQPKPAVEVIIVAMRPLSEKTYVDQALKNRKGITWLDDGRIPYESEDKPSAGNRTATFGTQETISGGDGSGGFVASNKGRFPANLIVSDDVLNDGRSGHSTGHYSYQLKKSPYDGGWKSLEDKGHLREKNHSFSRYFDLDAWFSERIKQLPKSAQKTFPFLIVPKASKSEKNKGCEDLPQLVVSGETAEFGKMGINTPEMRVKRGVTRKLPRYGNPHPTVKPLKLMSYLITLGSREGDTVVDPFIGTGSTAIACQILGRKCTGYEINANYCEIAKSRLTYYCQKAMNL